MERSRLRLRLRRATDRAGPATTLWGLWRDCSCGSVSGAMEFADAYQMPTADRAAGDVDSSEQDEVEPAVLRRSEWEAGATAPFATAGDGGVQFFPCRLPSASGHAIP